MSTKYIISFAKERKEYREIKKHNKSYNFDSVQSYMNSKEVNPKFIQDPREHFGHIFTNWYDFLQVDTSNFIEYKHDWIKFCESKNVKSLNDYYELCKLHKELPINPSDFYIGFVSIPIELGLYTKRRK